LDNPSLTAIYAMFDVGRSAFDVLCVSSVLNSRITVLIHPVHLRVPEVPVGFADLRRLFLFLLDRGEAFLFLISHAGSLRRLATDQHRGASYQANEVNVLHI
jgi:hypothetical protein